MIPFDHSPTPNFPHLSPKEMHPHSGCLSKLPPCDLEDLLGSAYDVVHGANAPINPMLAPDDCALIEVGSSDLLVTTDLIPLVGIDPQVAGQIAALHSMSDVFACGGLPNWAFVTMIAKPEHPYGFNDGVMAGLLQTCVDEDVEVCGGQTIVASDSMIGLTVIGQRLPNVSLGKLGGRNGDRLLLSKPLGVGLVVRAFRLGIVGECEFSEAIRIMTASNRSACLAAVACGVHSSTDVTGFGLLGHLVQMLNDGQGASLRLSSIPLLASLERLPDDFHHTLWTQGNLDYVLSRRPLVGIKKGRHLLPLLDPQTNGGLLVTADDAAARRLENQGFHDIGQITDADVVEIS